MANPLTVPGDLVVPGFLRVMGSYFGLTRSSLTQEPLVAYPLMPDEWQTWDAFGTPLPNTAASDDLGVVMGTFGTDFPYIWAGDLKNAGATTRRAARCLRLPAEYDPGNDVRFRFYAGMKTTVASVSATIDLEVFKSAGTGVPTGSPTDLCATAAQSINSLTHANKDFLLDASSLNPGDLLILRVSLAVNDSGTGTAVDARFTDASALLDIKG